MTVLTKLAYRNFQISIGNFFKKIEIFKFQNTTPTVLILFQPNFFRMFPVTIHTKLAFWNFEISKLNFLKKIEI